MADWGDVPGWVEAVATSFAFAGTTLLLWIESQRRKEEREAQERLQASKVAHWLDRSKRGHWELKYRNASDVPVYRIGLRVELNGEHLDSKGMSRIPPDQNERNRGEIDDWLHALLHNWSQGAGTISVEMTFADANGRRWMRDLDGRLKKLDGENASAEGQIDLQEDADPRTAGSVPDRALG